MFSDEKSKVPNAITLANLAFGCISITYAFKGEWVTAAWMVYIAALMDFLDGLAARLLKVNSPLGKDLDSLADVVSFGVAPAAGFYAFFKSLRYGLLENNVLIDLIPILFLLIPMLSALRLAKFNHDTRQTNGFRGLPTPALGLFNVSLIAALPQLGPFFVGNAPYLLGIAALGGSLLLVSDIPLMALKFKHYNFKENWMKYGLLAVSILFILFFGYAGICAAILFYIFFSIFVPVK